MFKVHKGKAPVSICELFEKQASNRQGRYNLRNHNDIDFYVPNRLCYKHLEKLPSYSYIKTFNSITMDIKESETVNIFYNAYKRLLMQEL